MREADIRPDHLMAEYLRLSIADAERFFPDVKVLPKARCPGCGGEESDAIFTKNGFPIVACTACSSLFANPRPSGEQLAEFYRDSVSARYWAKTFFPAVAEARRQQIFRPRAQRVLELASEHGGDVNTVTDVGAGVGLFLQELGRLKPSVRLRAVEPGRDAAEDCRAKNLETYEGFAGEAAENEIWAGGADLVVSFEVIEHLADPLDFLCALRALARPGGLILVSGLCGDGFDIQLLGEHSKAVAPPHHLTFLSQKGVRTLCQRAELEVLLFETPGQLDVEIVEKALKADDDLVTDPDLRHLLLDAGDQERAEFQKSLVAQHLSSHMWVIARRPA